MPDQTWKQLYQYWLSKHTDGRPPSRREIDPVIEIPRLAKNLMLIDARGEFTFRLVGSEVVERHGFDMTGRQAGTSGKYPAAIGEWMAALSYVARAIKPQLLIARIGSDAVAKNVMLILPLVDVDGRIEMVLVGSFYNEHFKPGTHIDGMTVTETAV